MRPNTVSWWPVIGSSTPETERPDEKSSTPPATWKMWKRMPVRKPRAAPITALMNPAATSE